MPYRTLNIGKNTDTYKLLQKQISSRIELALRGRTSKEQKWIEAEEAMIAFTPETDSDALRRTRREGGNPQYTTIVLPYTYAQVMTAHTYLSSVFFSRNPIHQLAGRNGTGEMQVMAAEAMLQYQVDVGGMLGPYYLWLYDAPKYGQGILGTYWDKRTVQYSEIVEQPDPNDPTKTQLVQRTVQVAGYEGNCAYNISPYDFLHDPRVTLANFQRGEFVCVKRIIPWNEIVKRQALGYYMNVDEIKSSGRQTPSTQGSGQVERPDTTLEPQIWDGRGTQHPSMVHAYEFYVELNQKEWGLGQATYPEKWVFTLTQDFSTIFGASPLGMAHGMFPFDVAEPELDAYAAFTRGVPEIMKGVQNTIDWLVNSHFYNVRQVLNNQFIGDPSRIMMKDVKNSGQPGFFFRLRPEAYGTDIRTVLMQLPVNDVTQTHLRDIDQMFQIGQRTLGMSDQMLGMASGGRTTATEVRTSTGFGVSRLKTVAEYISAMAFSPHAQKLLQNTQQFYSTPIKLRVVGDAASLAGPEWLGPVSPSDIAGQYDFMQVDGTLPIDRMAQANLWKELLMAFRAIPQLATSYDIAKIFAWTAQLSGLKNIDKMRVQVVPDEQAAAMAQAGNIVPIRPPNTPSGTLPGLAGGGALPAVAPTGVMGSPDASTMTGLNALGG